MKSIAIFGSTKVGDNIWRPGKKIWSIAIFGGAEVDFRKAEFDEKVTEVVAFSLFGGHKIIVPKNVNVTLGGFSLFGSKELKGTEGEEVSQKSDIAIQINAISIFSGCNVKYE